MCGRFVQKTPVNELQSFFGTEETIPNFPARYNLAPTQDAVVVVASPTQRQIVVKKWGLIPAWSKDGKAKFATFNARAETVHEKPAYQEAFRKRRCIIPADGFYEWVGKRTSRIPHLFERCDGMPLAMAGLYETWLAKDGHEQINSFTILVTAANYWMSSYHDRMPVILEPRTFDLWLKGSPNEAAPLMHATHNDVLKQRMASILVNNVKNDGPQLVALSHEKQLF